ncbi:putative transcription factor interactor and regulator CCHC(Zn) family [Medicago truncatula]|uniref:Putative transcription factor interactor and regulator CCHC(Zn) family n=2 Tax=Medicago truncatula TaxID=3880 RepID=A0A396IP11_MEDTR|nr:putative transcription factor interactor and regulator CCHC(Zn) family [Medicago truncatula]
MICKGSKGSCIFEAFCAKIPKEETWQLRKIQRLHSCSRVFKVKMLNSDWLGSKLNSRVREEPGLKLTTIVNRTIEKWGLKINLNKAYRARGKEIDMVDGSFRDQYTRIYDYTHELMRSNPDSTVKVSTMPYQGTEEDLERPGANLCPHFRRMYICLKACKDSFFKCRSIIGLDGCFLKGYYGGQLLAAIGRDPNDQMLPIAFVVVEGETKESWKWFLELLIGDLGGPRLCKTYTFISDQQKGLLPAMDELLPDVDQRFCVRHLYNNFRKRFPGKKLKELMWRAAKSTYENAFLDVMKEIKEISEPAYDYLMLIPTKHWSKWKFSGDSKCDTLVNNMSEAFNSTIVIPRQKPIVTMCEDIRVYLIEKWETNRNKITRYEDDVLPNIKKRLARESAYTNVWLVRRSTEFDYEVTHLNTTCYKYHVNLQRWECDCRKWLLIGLPCCHAISCMRNQDLNVYDFVPDIYKKERYAACYAPIIYPANGQALWRRTEYNDLQPPPIRRQPGRPKKKRNKEAGELLNDDGQLRRARWGIKCSRCKQSGHNKSTCKLPLPPPPPPSENSSNPTSTQGPSAPLTTQTPQTAQAPTAETAETNPAPTTQRSTNTQRNVTTQRTARTQRTVNTQRDSQTAPSAQGAAATQGAGTQAAQAGTGGGKQRKRKQKKRLSTSQPEGSNGKKRKTSVRVEGSVSTQQ